MGSVGAQGRHPTPIANRRLAIDSRSGGPRLGSASTVRYFDVEQRAISLAAEDVGVCGAVAWHPAVDRELDGHCRVEFDVVGDLPSSMRRMSQTAARDRAPLWRTRS